MGLDLTLIPVRYPIMEEVAIYPRTQINLDRDSILFERIKAEAKMIPLPAMLLWNYEGNMVRVDEDPYGVPLAYVKAKDLHPLFSETQYEWNMAAEAYLKRLHPDTKIILFWH